MAGWGRNASEIWEVWQESQPVAFGFQMRQGDREHFDAFSAVFGLSIVSLIKSRTYIPASRPNCRIGSSTEKKVWKTRIAHKVKSSQIIDLSPGRRDRGIIGYGITNAQLFAC